MFFCSAAQLKSFSVMWGWREMSQSLWVHTEPLCPWSLTGKQWASCGPACSILPGSLLSQSVVKLSVCLSLPLLVGWARAVLFCVYDIWTEVYSCSKWRLSIVDRCSDVKGGVSWFFFGKVDSTVFDLVITSDSQIYALQSYVLLERTNALNETQLIQNGWAADRSISATIFATGVQYLQN